MKNRDAFEIGLDELLGGVSAANLADPTLYQYYTCLKERRILINESITPAIVESVILPLLRMDNDGTGEPIEIILNTCGGSLYDGLALCNVIDNLKTPTTITVYTYAYSMGGLILLAGHNNPNVKKRALGFSTALIHAGSSSLSGDTASVRDTMEFNNLFEEKIKEYVVSHSNITTDEYDEHYRKQWYFTSDDMLKYGFIDEII